MQSVKPVRGRINAAPGTGSFYPFGPLLFQTVCVDRGEQYSLGSRSPSIAILSFQALVCRKGIDFYPDFDYPRLGSQINNI